MLTAYQDEHEPCFGAILKLISLHCKVKSGDTFSSAVLPYQNLLRRKSEKILKLRYMFHLHWTDYVSISRDVPKFSTMMPSDCYDTALTAECGADSDRTH